ncbi:MAG: glycoside hydrolase TIM-barrel-like domain-containing protein [Paracoccaceae bacterium]
MAQLILIPLGQALGGAIGGAVATAIGGAIGAIAGEYINTLLKPAAEREGPRLKAQDVTSSSEGAPMTMLWGRSRMAGNIIWATRLEEEVIKRTERTGGKGGPKVNITEYEYYANLAVALCEGEVSRIGRIWIDGKEIDQTKTTIRRYLGTETQMPDELIEAKEGAGAVSAYRGTAYIVFERLSVTEYGGRIPQITAELWRATGTLEPKLKAVALSGVGGGFGYDPLEQSQNSDGEAQTDNRHALTDDSDFSASLRELAELAPAVAALELRPQWYVDNIDCGDCQIRPGVADRVSTLPFAAHTASRATAAPVTRVFGQPLFGGTSDDAALVRGALEAAARGFSLTLRPELMLDPAPVYAWQKPALPASLVIAWSPELARFAGVGSGTGATSVDGISWAAHSMPARSWKSICWAPARGMFAAVASDLTGDTIYTSPDGIIWTAASAVAGAWRAVVWSESLGRFAAIGTAAPYVMWSDSGTSWTAGTGAVARSWGLLTYAPALKMFLALDTGSTNVMTSSDGKKWVDRATSGGGTTAWQRGVAWSESLGLFVSIGQFISNRQIKTSPDGITWTTAKTLGFNIFNNLAWAPEAGLFLAYAGHSDTLYASSDGVTWVPRASPYTALTAGQMLWCPDLARFIITDDASLAISNSTYKPALAALSCQPAPGEVGSPDAGGDTTELGTQVDDFFGTAAAGDFTTSVDAATGAVSLDYTGPVAWGYRRFILHYAKLVAALNSAVPGTIASFYIGAGLTGLTRLRLADSPIDPADYPVVQALKTLAADVRAVLGGGVAISYAADWREYGAYTLADGRVGWPLDVLWADGNIDFIGIDAAYPLSDWRDGLEHLDAQAGAATIYDIDYLKSGIEGGEFYDWRYADKAARDAQSRTTIADAVVGKPWVFRPKDLRNWWGALHYPRAAADSEEASPSDWLAEAKPIRLGASYPAIDKGTNAPGALFDPISAAHARPPYSSGARDDAIQRAALEAVADYWADAANNPTSGVYAGRMVDADALTFGPWDTRPFPAYPIDGRWFADADNYEYGTTLNGRLGVADAAGTIRKVLADFGYSAYVIGALGAVVDGATSQGGSSARAVLEGLQPALLFDVVETTGHLRFQHRGGPLIALSADSLVEREDDLPWTVQRAQETDLPLVIEMSYGELVTDDQTATVEARRGVGGSDRTARITLPITGNAARVSALAEIALAEAWHGREQLECTLPMSALRVEVGDLLALSGLRGLWRVGTIGDGAQRPAMLTRFDPRIYTPLRFARRTKHPVGGSIDGLAGSAAASPVVALMDLPLLLDGHDPDAGYMAGWMRPFGAGIAAYRSPSSENYTLDQVLPIYSIMGSTVEAFGPGPADRWDNGNALVVELFQGELAGTDDLSVFAGANALAVENEQGEWEIVQFSAAELVAPHSYRLTRLLRGVRGSEHAMRDPLPSGARVVVIDGGVVQTGLTSASKGAALNWRMGPSDRLVADPVFTATSFTFNGKGHRPYAPAQLRASAAAGGDIALSWVRRSRLGADNWEQVEIPLGEAIEAYEIDIMDGATVLRTISTATPAATYTAAEQTTDFGAPQTSITFHAYQISASYGRGIAANYSGALT